MCAGAIVHVRLDRVVFGASDPKAGAAGSALNLLQFPTLNHQCQITPGVREPECRRLLQSFFAEQRQKTKTAEQAAGAVPIEAKSVSKGKLRRPADTDPAG